VRLPVGEPDPAARLQAVKTAMDRVRATGEGVVVSGALAVVEQTPVQVEQRWLDLFAGRAGVGLSVCSRAGERQIGVAVDGALVPDGDRLLTALAQEVATFRELQ
jgi:16S rRNA G966 N2-methylase RsmD